MAAVKMLLSDKGKNLPARGSPPTDQASRRLKATKCLD